MSTLHFFDAELEFIREALEAYKARTLEQSMEPMEPDMKRQALAYAQDRYSKACAIEARIDLYLVSKKSVDAIPRVGQA